MIAPSATSSVFRQVRGLEVLTWPAFDASGADVLVTTRHGGVSAGPYASLNLSFNVGDDPAAVLENRHRAAAAIGAGLDDVVFAEQIHGAVAQVVGAADRGRGARAAAGAMPGADALVTADPGVVLAVLAADCVPLVLYDPVARVLACAHAGWRGTVAGAAASAVAAMRSLGAEPADVVAGLGPAIAAGCYQVGAEVAGAATSAFAGRAPDVLRATGPGQWQFDLWAANRLILQDAGVPASQIHISGTPTGPTDPANPASPANPANPANPASPAGPTGPASSASPAGPASPAGSTDPPNPASPAGPASPTGPTDPANPASLAGPTSRPGPTGPATGAFFSHRAERPCGRFAALARIRPAESANSRENR